MTPRARTGFSGVVRVDRARRDRAVGGLRVRRPRHRIPNTVETQFATASGTKTLTALAVMALVERGTLGWARPPGRCSATTCRWSPTT